MSIGGNGYLSSEWQTIILGPWGYPDLRYDDRPPNPYFWTFPVLPQVASGHTKVFPPRSTLGPTDPDIDDTLSTANWMDLTGGQGIAIINPATDMGRTWWHTSDARYTDGITNPPEVTKGKPTSSVGNCTPVGTIGTTAYGLWGEQLYRWLPDTRQWGPTTPMRNIGVVTGPGVAFNNRMYWPQANGYVSIAETSPGVLGPPVNVSSPLAPPFPGDGVAEYHSTPRVWRFGVFDQNLYAVTVKDDRYTLCYYIASTDTWVWPLDRARQSYVTVDSGAVPSQLISWVDAMGQGPALWLITDMGCLRYNPHTPAWEHTTLWNVPPHPNWGRAATPFRPGEALWITSGGGDLTQYAANGVVVPASGPGGRGFGMPADRRGDIISMSSDLANLYVLCAGEPVADTLSEIEDTSGADPLYFASTASVTSVLAGTGKGWHPLWEATDDPGAENYVVGDPTEIVVAKTLRNNGKWDFSCFWGVGEFAFSMPCRLTSYSAAQGRQRGIDRFAARSYIELGEFAAGSINAKKLWSHGALKLKYGSPPAPDALPGTRGANRVEVTYTTDTDTTDNLLGWADVTNERIVLPFGLDVPPGAGGTARWSAGEASYWIKPKLWLYGAGGVQTPVLQAFSLSFLPLRMDAQHAVFTIPLPVEVDERSGKTTQQIHDLVHHLMHDEVFHHLHFQGEDFRVVISGASHTEIVGQDFVGAIKLNVIQIPTGRADLVGEMRDSHG